jgi:hypothetical protein
MAMLRRLLRHRQATAAPTLCSNTPARHEYCFFVALARLYHCASGVHRYLQAPPPASISPIAPAAMQ